MKNLKGMHIQHMYIEMVQNQKKEAYKSDIDSARLDIYTCKNLKG